MNDIDDLSGPSRWYSKRINNILSGIYIFLIKKRVILQKAIIFLLIICCDKIWLHLFNFRCTIHNDEPIYSIEYISVYYLKSISTFLSTENWGSFISIRCPFKTSYITIITLVWCLINRTTVYYNIRKIHLTTLLRYIASVHSVNW